MSAIDIDIELYKTQLEFVSSMVDHPAYIGGFAAGKTFAGAMKALCHVSKWNIGLPGLVIAPTYKTLKATSVRAVRGGLDPSLSPYETAREQSLEAAYEKITTQLEQADIDYIKKAFAGDFNISDAELKLPAFRHPQTNEPSSILFRSADNPESIESLTVAWVWIDEAPRCKKGIWSSAVSRARHPMRMLLDPNDPESFLTQVFVTGTPNYFNWAYELWEGAPPSDQYKLFEAATSENWKIGKKAHKAIWDSLSESERIQKYRGKFSDAVQGRVYRYFSRFENIDESEISNGQWYLCCDFNISPCAWMIARYDTRTINFIDEIYEYNTDTFEMTDRAAQWFKSRGIPLGSVIVIPDASGKNRATSAGKNTDHSIIRKKFKRLITRAANPYVKDRVNIVNREMKKDDSIRIHPRCTRYINDLEKVIWKDSVKGIIDKGDSELTHASDSGGYLIYYIHGATKISSRQPQTLAQLTIGR